MMKVYRKENEKLLLLAEVENIFKAHNVIFKDIEDRNITDEIKIENTQIEDYFINEI